MTRADYPGDGVTKRNGLAVEVFISGDGVAYFGCAYTLAGGARQTDVCAVLAP